MWYLKISLLVIFTINPILRLSKAIATDGCGQTIGCLRVPSGCELSKCNYLATYKSQGNQVTFELLGKGAGWVSIGFSNDQKMSNTDAVLCYNNNSKVEIRSAKLIGRFLPKLQEEKELVFIDDSTLGGRSIQCRFRHPLKPNTESSNLRNLEESVFLLYALGDQSSNNIPSYHGRSASKRGSSATRVNITQMNESKATSLSDLNKRIHGSLMVVVWIFLASIGLFFVRYTRNIWPDIKLLDNKVWFQFHRSLMIIVVLGTISSIVVIFVDLDGFTEGKDKIKIHAILGLVVFVLAILQPIGALFRPHPDASKRPIFNFIHRLLGLSAFIISLAAIVLGLDIFEKKEAFHAVLGYVGFLGLVILIMEIIKLSWKTNEKETGAGVIPGGMEMQTPIAETNTTHLTFSTFFLGTLIVVSLAVAVVVIYYINKTDD